MVEVGQSRRRVAAILAAIVTAATISTASAADFRAGWDAYQRGDFEKALQEWRPLAESGHVSAQFNLGVMYDEGRGVEVSRDKAIEWWTKAGEQGDMQAQHNLALLYISAGSEADYDKALSWLRRAAESGSIPSQYSLGKMYGYGLGVGQDDGEAFKFVRMAAESGFDKAQYNLGKMYRDGRGTPENIAESAKWFQAAADRGHANAQNKVGLRMAKGKDGFKKDPVKALMWLILAEQGGSKAAVENRPALARKLSAEDVKKAEEMAANWTAQPNGS